MKVNRHVMFVVPLREETGGPSITKNLNGV